MKFGIAVEKSVPTDESGFDARIERTQLWTGDHNPSDERIYEVLKAHPDEINIVVIQQQRRLHMGWKAIEQFNLNDLN